MYALYIYISRVVEKEWTHLKKIIIPKIIEKTQYIFLNTPKLFEIC